MADTDNTTSTDTNDQGNKGPSLRQQLDQSIETNKTLTAENSELKQYKLINESKLGHLSDMQRSALMSTFKPDDKVDSEKLMARAKELGFPEQVTTTPPDQNQNQQQQGQQQDQSQVQNFVPQGNQAVNQDPNATPNVEVDQALAGLSEMERAQVMAMRGAPPTVAQQFQEGLAKAKTPQEAEAWIRANGPAVGIAMDTQVE